MAIILFHVIAWRSSLKALFVQTPVRASSCLQGKENMLLGQDDELEEVDIFADPFAKKLDEQAAKRQAKLTRRFQGRKAPKM